METRRCKSGAHEIPTYIDFCGECGEFLDNIVVCPICKSPTKRSEKPDLQLCRGRFNLVPCNAENKPIRHKGFRVPAEEDIKNAKERYRRLKEREVQRSSGSYRAFTVTLQNVPPAAEAGLPQTSNLAPMPVSDPPALGAGGRLSVVATLLTSPPSAHSSPSAPTSTGPKTCTSGAHRDFNIGRPRADTRSAGTLAHDHSDPHRLASPTGRTRTGDQTGNVPHYATGESACALTPVIQSDELASGLDHEYADVTRVVHGHNVRSSLPVSQGVEPPGAG